MSISSTKSQRLGIIEELHSMLTNHTDRPKFILNVFLLTSEGALIQRSNFEIFANDPISKIEEKVTKMRLKGGITTLKIAQIKKSSDNEYTLELSV